MFQRGLPRNEYFCTTSVLDKIKTSANPDSNQGPSELQSLALPLSYPRYWVVSQRTHANTYYHQDSSKLSCRLLEFEILELLVEASKCLPNFHFPQDKLSPPSSQGRKEGICSRYTVRHCQDDKHRSKGKRSCSMGCERF